ncbi:MAG TPA: type II secretion system protein [Gammaproteobacteria bacterium]|nr:type II secretion system protein [Gammaproteobacteria bacterium]
MNRRQKGFTLIEMVLVIIIIAVASVPLFSLFSQASLSLMNNEDIQTATQLAQERAERILALHRKQGFNAVPDIAPGNITENLTGNFTGFTRTTDITQPVIPPAGCPPGALCNQVVVSVNRDGTALAQVSLLLVNY